MWLNILAALAIVALLILLNWILDLDNDYD
jgi:hypothetical protein